MTGFAAALPGTSIARGSSTSEFPPGNESFYGEHTISAHNDPPTTVASTFPAESSPVLNVANAAASRAEALPVPDTNLPLIDVEEEFSTSKHASDVDGAFEVELEEHDELEDDEDHPDVPVNQESPSKRLTAQVRESVIARFACFEPIVQKIAEKEGLQTSQVWDLMVSYFTPKLHARDPSNPWNQYRSFFLEYTPQELRRIYPALSDEGE